MVCDRMVAEFLMMQLSVLVTVFLVFYRYQIQRKFQGK